MGDGSDQNQDDTCTVGNDTVNKVRSRQGIGHAEGQKIVGVYAEISSLVHSKTERGDYKSQKHDEKAQDEGASFKSTKQPGQAVMGKLYDVA